MVKADIIEKIRGTVNIPRGEVVRIVELIFDVIKETLKQEGKVAVSRFGRFTVRDKRRRRGRNPKTGGEMEIIARRVLTFKPSEELKASLNKPKGMTAPPL